MSPMNGRSTPLRSKMRKAEADLTCSRCGRTSSLRKAKDWNFTVKAGRIVGTLCAKCQTPEENAEAVINEATTTYAVDSFGRLIGTTKGGAR